jgi:hypothetical protein
MSLTDREEAWLVAAAVYSMHNLSDCAAMGKPYVKLGGDNPDYIWQDGTIFAWSESNVAYQLCWWLTSTGKPVAVGSDKGASHVANLLKDRPFDPDWLKAVVPAEGGG